MSYPCTPITSCLSVFRQLPRLAWRPLCFGRSRPWNRCGYVREKECGRWVDQPERIFNFSYVEGLSPRVNFSAPAGGGDLFPRPRDPGIQNVVVVEVRSVLVLKGRRTE